MYVFQKDDTKFRKWCSHLSAHGISATAIEGSPILAPLYLVRTLLSGHRVDGYVFRYLNDYPSFAKSVLRALSEVAVILLTKALRGRIIWIAHNVDKESEESYPRISRLRRRIVGRAADVVLTTDPLLLPYAARMLPQGKALDWLCFGAPELKSINDDTRNVKLALQRLRSQLRHRNPAKDVFVGLCVSSPGVKYTHFLSVCDFVERHSSREEVFGVVVVGDIQQVRDARFVAARSRMARHEQVELINRRADVRGQHVVGDVDFVYRVMDDQSVPMTAYVAAAMGVPMVTEGGFLAEFVTTYGLGVVAGGTGPSLGQSLREWDSSAAGRFLESRSWAVGANRLTMAMRGLPAAARCGRTQGRGIGAGSKGT